MYQTLIKKNFPHVVIVTDLNGSTEDLDPVTEFSDSDIQDAILGIKELHSADISVLDIKVGRGAEGQVKIRDPTTFGFGDTKPIHTRYNLPETSIVKFKSDLWCLGCLIYGKNIPKRFLKSQELLDNFMKNSKYFEILKNLLVIDPSKRNLDFIKDSSHNGCIIH